MEATNAPVTYLHIEAGISDDLTVRYEAQVRTRTAAGADKPATELVTLYTATQVLAWVAELGFVVPTREEIIKAVQAESTPGWRWCQKHAEIVLAR